MKTLFVSFFFSSAIASAAPTSFTIQCLGNHFDYSGINKGGDILIKLSSDGRQGSVDARWLQDQEPIIEQDFVCGTPIKESCGTVVRTFGDGGHSGANVTLEGSVSCGKSLDQTAVAQILFWQGGRGKVDCHVRNGNWWGIELRNCVAK